MSDRIATDGVRLAIRALAVAVVVGASAWLAIDLTRPHGGVTIIWAASGLLAGILLTSPHRVWPTLIVAALIGNLTARVLYGDAAVEVISRGVASTLDACLLAYLLRYRIGDIADPEKLATTARTAILGTLLATAISALLVATTSAVRGTASFGPIFFAWFASHALGMVIFATLLVVAWNLGWALFGRPGKRWKFARSIGLVAATTLAVFSQTRFPWLFLIFPPLLLAVFRHRFAGVVVGVATMLMIAVAATILGHGPLYLIVGASTTLRTLQLQLFIATACLISLPVAFVLLQRSRLAALLRDSERSYRVLADNSRDIVVRMRADGQRLYVSPSVKEMLGWEPHELSEARWELIHPDDRGMLIETIATLIATGEAMTVISRALHKNGSYVWIEAMARLVPGTGADQPAEIIYSGRDVSQRVAARQARAETEQRLRAITDNMPALVMHIDTEQKYTFSNAFASEVFGIEAANTVGRTIAQVRGEHYYASVRPYVEAALRGERVTFEGEFQIGARRCYHQTSYIPDFAPDGAVRGFYVMTYDISELERVKQQLMNLAQHDSLTGLGNRNKFRERLSFALANAARNRHMLALVYLDIDHFKEINDLLGHAVGDAILCEFARRLENNIRETDLAVRLGGDEFAIIIENIDSPAAPEIIARKLIDAMRTEFVANAATIKVTASIGIGICLETTSADALMLAADSALYQAKAAGRDTYRMSEIA